MRASIRVVPMRIRRAGVVPRLRLAAACAALLAVSVGMVAGCGAGGRVQQESLEADPAFVLRVLPKGGEQIEASIGIAEGTGENAVAKAVTRSLQVQLPEDLFKVERDDGEDVLIKKRRGAADFEIVIVSNSVAGVRIRPDRE